MEHNDAADSIYFATQLQQIRARPYDPKYAETMIRKLVPVNNSDDPGASQIGWEEYDAAGVAKWLSNYATDFPTVAINGKQNFVTPHNFGQGTMYSAQEVRAARFAGKPLEAKKVDAVMRSMEQFLDRVGAVGDTQKGLVGLLNIANAQTFTLPSDGTGASQTFASKTGALVVRDLNNIANKITTTTKGVWKPDTLLMPLDVYAYIASTPWNSNGDTTILKFFLANNPYITSVVPWEKCTGAGAGGTNRIVCYKRDPEVLELVIPMEARALEPEREGLVTKLNWEARTAGVICFHPLAILYADGA